MAIPLWSVVCVVGKNANDGRRFCMWGREPTWACGSGFANSDFNVSIFNTSRHRELVKIGWIGGVSQVRDREGNMCRRPPVHNGR